MDLKELSQDAMSGKNNKKNTSKELVVGADEVASVNGDVSPIEQYTREGECIICCLYIYIYIYIYVCVCVCVSATVICTIWRFGGPGC